MGGCLSRNEIICKSNIEHSTLTSPNQKQNKKKKEKRIHFGNSSGSSNSSGSLEHQEKKGECLEPAKAKKVRSFVVDSFHLDHSEEKLTLSLPPCPSRLEEGEINNWKKNLTKWSNTRMRIVRSELSSRLELSSIVGFELHIYVQADLCKKDQLKFICMLIIQLRALIPPEYRKKHGGFLYLFGIGENCSSFYIMELPLYGNIDTRVKSIIDKIDKIIEKYSIRDRIHPLNIFNHSQIRAKSYPQHKIFSVVLSNAHFRLKNDSSFLASPEEWKLIYRHHQEVFKHLYKTPNLYAAMFLIYTQHSSDVESVQKLYQNSSVLVTQEKEVQDFICSSASKMMGYNSIQKSQIPEDTLRGERFVFIGSKLLNQLGLNVEYQ